MCQVCIETNFIKEHIFTALHVKKVLDIGDINI